jgi:phosphoribosylformylglycinamidine synthase subunit PurL
VTLPAELHRELGLTDDELNLIINRMGRAPTHTELAMFSVMWSEHCSYKSSRIHLKKLPTDGPAILVGPGEGAGVIEVAPGVAVAWKMESHNHPSFVEPVNGAATGVGGIVRDILSMGARPIALLDSLRFGRLDKSRTRYLVDGVVSGISSYGNSIGVPTVGGEAAFEDCYGDNPLVNVACLGIIDGRLMHAAAEFPGRAVILVGSSTGRDGIGGASVLASAEFGADSESKRPSVQVGDPFTEKLLIEACLELIERGLVDAIQDLGAGGITCPVAEMASKGGTGMRIEVDTVNQREPGMAPFEVMISESQERMLVVTRPDLVGDVLAVCERWELAARKIGEVTIGGRVEVVAGGQIVADVEASALADAAPAYERPSGRPEWLVDLRAGPPGDEAPGDPADALMRLLGSASVCSKRWIWEQYDHMIFLGTVRGPGADAAVIRLPGRDLAVALSVDGNARYCYLDPYEGARLIVAESARNVACVGARPLAITNCLNFGSPEKPEVMWQFTEVVAGIGDACRALGTPVTGGNVSFYNETGGRAIFPTPVVGMLGVVDSAHLSVGTGWTRDGDQIVVLGTSTADGFGGSEFAHVINGTIAGRPPQVDLGSERALHEVLVTAARECLCASAHDISLGGLGVALAIASIWGGRGFSVNLPAGELHRVLFNESPSRAVVSCRPANVPSLVDLAERNGVEAATIGETGGDKLEFGQFVVDLDSVTRRFETALPTALSDTIS